MSRTNLFIGVLPFAVACGGPDEGLDLEPAEELGIGTSASPIEVGSNDVSNTSRDAVALVGGCTATLVAPNILVTAGHCNYDDPTYADGNWHDLPWDVPVSFGPDRDRPIFRTTAFQVSAPPLAAPPWPDDIVLLRLRASVPTNVARPRPMLLDRPAGLSTSTVIYQVGYGGVRDRRYMTGRNYRDWITKPTSLINGFEYTSDVRGPGIGDRDTNIEQGDSGGPMLFGGMDGPVMGVLSHWAPYGIATFGPGGSGRSDIRGWLRGKVPQLPDLSVTSVFARGCTGSGGEPTVGVTVRNTGTVAVPFVWLDVFPGVTSPPSVGVASAFFIGVSNFLPLETRTLSVPISRSYQNRTVGVGAVIDSFRAASESNESNNVRFTSSVTFPDCSFN